MTTFIASSTVFGALIFAALAGVALAVVFLAFLIVRDWRTGKLW